MIYDLVINGFSRTGKDTFISFLTAEAKADVINVSSIDPFRGLPHMFGWNGEKDGNYRKCLSLLKEASTYIEDYPVRFLLKERALQKKLRGKSDILMCYHIREPEEIKKLKKNLPNLITLLFRGTKEKEQQAPSTDDCILDYDYDHTIANSGSLEELQIKAKQFLETIIDDSSTNRHKRMGTCKIGSTTHNP